MLLIRSFRVFGLLLIVCLLAACGEEDRRWAGNTEYIGGYHGNTRAELNKRSRAEDTTSFWDGDGVPGTPHIEIRLSEQRAYFYKGDQMVGISQISSGKEGHNTPTGTYKVIQKDKEHRSSLYGDYVDPATQQVVKSNVESGVDPKPPGTAFLGSSMPFFLRVVGGVGMHAGYLPGVPASHGCIRMPEFMAENFFYNTPMGTPVAIVN